MPRILGLKEENAISRRSTAVHEAGHFVIADHFGVPDVSAYICGMHHAGSGVLTWGGGTRGVEEQRLGALERRMFGFAGAVAEFCWWREDVDRLCEDPEAYFSLSDLRAAQCESGEFDELHHEAARRVAKLFHPDTGELWPELCRTARALIVADREQQLRQQRRRIVWRLTQRARRLAA